MKLQKEILDLKLLTYREEGAEELLKTSKIRLADIDKIVEEADIIFVPIQTPHEEKYEGTTRIPEERADFNYDYLVNGIKELNEKSKNKGKIKLLLLFLLSCLVLFQDLLNQFLALI